MKKLILATAVTAGVIAYFMGDKDQAVDDQELIQNHTEHADTVLKETTTPAAQVIASGSSDSSVSSTSSRDENYSSYNQDYNEIENSRASNNDYSRYNGGYESYNDEYNSSSYNEEYNEDDSNYDRDASYSSDSADSESDKDSDKSNDADKKEEQPTEKFQRIYDNGIIWYGDNGSLNIQYQSSSPETAGIGFRLHYDSSSIKVVSVTQHPIDAIITTTPESSRPDASNFDENGATNAYLTFAWASMYADWPKANQLNLATVEFERLYTGSENYSIDYSVISNQAGFQFVK